MLLVTQRHVPCHLRTALYSSAGGCAALSFTPAQNELTLSAGNYATLWHPSTDPSFRGLLNGTVHSEPLAVPLGLEDGSSDSIIYAISMGSAKVCVVLIKESLVKPGERLPLLCKLEGI